MARYSRVVLKVPLNTNPPSEWMASGSGIMPLNSLGGSTMHCCAWRYLLRSVIDKYSEIWLSHRCPSWSKQRQGSNLTNRPVFVDLSVLPLTSEMWCWSRGRGIFKEYWKKNRFCFTILYTIIMVHKGMNSSYSLVDYRALILLGLAICLPSAPLCLWCSWYYICINFFFFTSFSLPFSELSLVGLALGLVD